MKRSVGFLSTATKSKKAGLPFRVHSQFVIIITFYLLDIMKIIFKLEVGHDLGPGQQKLSNNY